MGTYLGEQSRMSLSANPWRKVPVYSYMAGVLAGAELGLASIKALAGLAYPWQCGGRGGVEIAGLARSGRCAMGERRTRTGGGSRVATPYWPAAQRGDQQAADDACVVLGRCVSDCASKALRAGGTAGLVGLQCATHCRLHDCVLPDTVPSTVHVGSPARSLAVTLRCGSCVVMRQQGIAAAV